LALSSVVVGRSETHEPQVGEDPPPLGLEAILQAPPPIRELAGRA